VAEGDESGGGAEHPEVPAELRAACDAGDPGVWAVVRPVLQDSQRDRERGSSHTST